MRRTLATRSGITLVGALLLYTGALCPSCGHGTRVTSTRWAKCKQCGSRVARRPMPDADSLISTEP